MMATVNRVAVLATVPMASIWPPLSANAEWPVADALGWPARKRILCLPCCRWGGLGEAYALGNLGSLQGDTGDYRAAVASLTRALDLLRKLGHRPLQASTLNDLGMVQQLTGDCTAAAASHQQALQLNRDLGLRLAEAETLISLGELATRTSVTRQARERHAQALAIARQIGVPLTEARALEGIGQSHLQDGNPAEAAADLRHALTIYQRIGSPEAQRVQETLRDHRLTAGTTSPPASPPSSKGPSATHPAASNLTTSAAAGFDRQETIGPAGEPSGP